MQRNIGIFIELSNNIRADWNIFDKINLIVAKKTFQRDICFKSDFYQERCHPELFGNFRGKRNMNHKLGFSIQK